MFKNIHNDSSIKIFKKRKIKIKKKKEKEEQALVSTPDNKKLT